MPDQPENRFLVTLRRWWTGRHDCPRCGVMVPTPRDEFCPSCNEQMQEALEEMMKAVDDELMKAVDGLLADTERKINDA